MTDLRLSYKRKNWVIQDRHNGRKQIGKPFKSKRQAGAKLKLLIADDASGNINLSNRYKFREEYPKYAEHRISDTMRPGSWQSKSSVLLYRSLWNNYISKCFPDIYLDEVTGAVFEQFVKDCYKLNPPATYKTCKNMVNAIKTFLRWCLSRNKIKTCSALYWQIHKEKHLRPDDAELVFHKKTTVITPQQVDKVLTYLIVNKDKDFTFSFKFAFLSACAFLGLRKSEIYGIKKECLNLDTGTVWIDGTFSGGIFKRKTKTESSRRSMDLDDRLVVILKWWLNKIKDMRNPYLFPATRGSNPMCDYKVRKMVWEVYEANDLAKISWNRKGKSVNMKVIWSPFKGCPIKTFRHHIATSLINAMATNKVLNANYVKKFLGHSEFTTTQNIYGNHEFSVSDQERSERKLAVAKALKFLEK